jgi:ferredoxin
MYTRVGPSGPSTPHREGWKVKLLKSYAEKCVRCGACMAACSKAYFKEEDPSLSRIRVTDVGSMPNINVCNQCGACIEVCPTQALERDKNGVVQLKKDKCTSCMMCVGYCPTASMFFNAAKQSQPFKCIACGLCAKACPTGALEMIG